MNAFFEYLVSEGLIKAIYLTLFHSVWQGAIISVIAGIIMVTTRRSNSAWRYNLLLISLLLFVTCTIFTFVRQWEDVMESVQTLKFSNTGTHENVIHTAVAQNNVKVITDRIVTFFNNNANSIVIFWFLVICFKCSQLLIGLSETFRLRKEQIFSAGDYWEIHLKELSGQLGINQYIHIAQSGLAKIPLTIGYIKPIILIPFGLLAAMPHDQIEAILLHELAHIRRKDYLVNILQSLVEILFFFNPAVWWLSSLLRAERENCCDDLAVSKTSSKTNYIKALVAFEEYRGAVPQYASAMSGSKNNLLNRAKRLIYNHNKTLNPMEKIILTCGLVITGMLTLAFTKIEKNAADKHTNQSVTAPKLMSLKSIKTYLIADNTNKTSRPKAIRTESGIDNFDTIKSYLLQDTVKKASNGSINTKIDGKMYKMITKDGKITELYVDNVLVPDDKINDYKTVTDKMQAEATKDRIMADKVRLESQQSRLAAQDARKQAEKLKVLAYEHAAQAQKQGADSKIISEKMKQVVEDVNRQTSLAKIQVEKMNQRVEAFKHESLVVEKMNAATKSLEDAKEQAEKIKINEDLNKQMDQIKTLIEKLKTDSEKLKRAAADDKKSGRVDYKIEKNVYASQSIDIKPNQPLFDVRERARPVRAARPDYLNSRISRQSRNPVKNIYGDKVVQELIDEGVIKDKNVSFHINNNELTVNGVKQSDEILRKVLSKTGITGSDNIDLNYSNTTTTRSETK